MEDVLPYAVSICFSYWLMNKAVSASGPAGCSRAGLPGWEEEHRVTRELPCNCQKNVMLEHYG